MEAWLSSTSTSEGGPMYTVRIEHRVPDFAAWKAAFDGDPVGR